MLKLTEDQYILVKEYRALLNTVEEAMDYIVQSFGDLEKTEGDRLLADVFSALPHIEETNGQLKALFHEGGTVAAKVTGFQTVVKQVISLEENFSDLNKKQTIIRENLQPAFAAWNRELQMELTPYIQS